MSEFSCRLTLRISRGAAVTKYILYYSILYCNFEQSQNQTKVVIKSDEGNAKKKAESPTKVCNQGGHWVDQVLSWNSCIGDSPQRKGNSILQFDQWRFPLIQETVLFVLTWLQTSSKLEYVLQISCSQLFIYVVIVPKFNNVLESTNFKYTF